MTYDQLVYVHLGTVLPAFAIGTYLLLNRKGTPRHKALGRVYLPLMVVTGIATLFLPAEVGPRVLGHFGIIHAFSLLTLFSVPAAVICARRGDITAHRGYMIGVYVGGFLIAGSLAFLPGRRLHELLF